MDYFMILKEIMITINKYCIVCIVCTCTYKTYILANPSQNPRSPQNPSLEVLSQLYLFAWNNRITFVSDISYHL